MFFFYFGKYHFYLTYFWKNSSLKASMSFYVSISNIDIDNLCYNRFYNLSLYFSLINRRMQKTICIKPITFQCYSTEKWRNTKYNIIVEFYFVEINFRNSEFCSCAGKRYYNSCITQTNFRIKSQHISKNLTNADDCFQYTTILKPLCFYVSIPSYCLTKIIS